MFGGKNHTGKCLMTNVLAGIIFGRKYFSIKCLLGNGLEKNVSERNVSERNI
jgi:hypothetical protein